MKTLQQYEEIYNAYKADSENPMQKEAYIALVWKIDEHMTTDEAITAISELSLVNLDYALTLLHGLSQLAELSRKQTHEAIEDPEFYTEKFIDPTEDQKTSRKKEKA